MRKIAFIIVFIIQLNITFRENTISSTNGENIKKNYSSNINNNYKPKNIGIIFTFLIISLGLFIIYTAIRNTIKMNKYIEEILSIFKNNFKLEELELGDAKKLIIKKILTFNSKVYHIEGLGFISIMKCNIGIMQMITVEINPYEKDLPQITCEFIYLFYKRTFLIRIYDFMLDKKSNKYLNYIKRINEINDKNPDLKKAIIKKNWYDSFVSATIKKTGTVKQENKIINMFKEVLEAYIEFAKESSLLSEEEKEKKYLIIKGFCEKFIEKGGIAVNFFKKNIGIEKTTVFLGKVIFCNLLFKDLQVKGIKKVKNE
jgi:hypothetical protein